VIEKGLGMKTLAGCLAPYLPEPELKVEIAPSGEFPCIERLLVGDSSRNVLYLQNWGGLDQKCRVTLPEEMRDWRLTRIEGEFIRSATGVETTIEGSQSVAVCILSAPGADIPDFKLSDAEKKKLLYVQNLMQFVSGNGKREEKVWEVEPLKSEIAFPDFEKLDLRIGVVESCEIVPKSSKLLKFVLDAGSLCKRTIFSGIRQAYPEPEKLVGKEVVFVANLAPRKMSVGVSEGMILFAGEPGVNGRVLSPSSDAGAGVQAT
jgi:methionine--tRNA ligase beta chain